MTRSKVLQLGFLILALGGIGYGAFRLVGLDGTSAGIASEAILVLIVVLWTGSYLLRVVTGKMTFNEQRRRYRQAYEKLTTEQLQLRFDSMTEEQQINLIKELGLDKEFIDHDSD